MKTNPLVSVITPAYNVEHVLEETIKSVLNQTYNNFEFIILEDASPDNTWQIIQKWAKKDKRIIPVKNETNLYIAENRNKGLLLAKGKYIVWQDADDISVSSRIEKQVEFMEQNPDVAICGGYLQSFNSTGLLDIRKYATTDTDLRKNIFKFSPVAQPAAIIRSSVFKKIGNYNPKYPPVEDLDMAFRIGQHYKFANLPQVVIKYREHEGSSTQNKHKIMIDNTLKIRKKYSKGYGYTMNFLDYLAYFATWCTKFINPTITMKLFKFARKAITLGGFK